MWEVVLDAVIDSLKLLPFLVVVYILIELLEQKTDLSKPHGGLTGKFAPLVGGATGIIPQCGFSVMAAKLYQHRHITVGTLLSVFIATSDEAFIIMLASGTGAVAVMPMVALKILIGVVTGYVADAIVSHETVPVDEEHEHGHYDGTSCGREHEGKPLWKVYFLSPVLHSLKVFAFILLVNFVFGTLFYLVGEERVVAFLGSGYWVQPLVTSLVGLIPNCASSVVLTQTFLIGGISFGSCLAGLCVNAGLGILFLLKERKERKGTLFIVLTLFLVGVATGYLVNAFQLIFNI